MSQTNAIHGIVMLGGLIGIGSADDALEIISHRDRLRHDQHRRRFHGHRPHAGMFGGRKRKPKTEPSWRPAPGSPVSDTLAALSPNSDFVTACRYRRLPLFI
jgi:hypothetical protein